MSPMWSQVALAVIAIVSVARLTRLWTQDTWPPVAKMRAWWMRFCAKREWEGWEDLATCPFCAAPWIALVIGGWGYLTGFSTIWLVFNGWMAMSYLASMVVVRDGE